MKKGILLIILILLVGMVFFVSAFEDVYRYRFQEDWNLVYGFISPDQLTGETTGGIVENSQGRFNKENILAIYAFVPTVQKYALVYPDPSEEDYGILRSIDDDELVQMSFWVYADRSGSAFYAGEEVVPFEDRLVYAGWNFIGITPDIAIQPGEGAEYTLGEIVGSCSIEKAYLFLNGQWFDIFENGGMNFELDDDLVYHGLVIKVVNDCYLGLEEIDGPPPIPDIDSSSTCTDTDGGENYFVKGHIVNERSDLDGLIEDNWDACVDAESVADALSGDQPLVVMESNVLREYYCGTIDIYPDRTYTHSTYYDCPNGCVDGTCVE